MIRTRDIYWLIPFVTVLFLISGCTKDKADPPPHLLNDNNGNGATNKNACDTLFNSFSQDIEPIFAQECATSGCHDQSSQIAGIVLETHAQIRSETKNGQVLCAIRHEASCTNMPYQEAQLSQDKIKAIECWADAGYPND